MGLMDPLLIDAVIGPDDVFLATTEERPSGYPQFSVLVTLEESILDMLMVGLASAELFGVSSDPV